MRQLHIAFVFICLLVTSTAQAATVTISESIPFAEDSGATDKVKVECAFETRLPNYIRKAAKKPVKIALSSEPLEDAEGKVLILNTTNVFALGGGGYSGSKSVTISGELRENGEVIGSLTARRHTIFGVMPGTCSILKRLAKKLGKDVALWLAEPTMDALLGDSDKDAERAAEEAAATENEA